MEVLSPLSPNVPMKPRTEMKKTKTAIKKEVPKEVNPDKIDDKWRPATIVLEPGPESEMYTTGKKLGKGGFAVCFEGKLERTSQVFALKVVKSHVEQKKQREKASKRFMLGCQYHLTCLLSSEQSSRFMPKCIIRTSWSSTAPFPSKIIPMSSSSSVHTGLSWKWSRVADA